MRRGPRPATAETSVDSKASDVSVKKQSKHEHKKAGINPDSVKGRTLALLDSKPSELFTAKKTAEALGQPVPSVRTVLCDLFKDRFIAKPKAGEYQSLKG